MAKKNAWLAKVQLESELRAKHRAEMHRRFALQQGQDMACIALNRAFGFGPERCRRFVEAYAEVFTSYAELAIEDAGDDDEIIYTKAKVDEMLRQCFGEDIVPFEERYAWCFRLSDREQPKGEKNYRRHNNG